MGAPVNALLSSASDEWLTPMAVIACLDKLPIALDPCSHEHSLVNARSTYNIRRGEDGLGNAWDGLTFVNPPYSQLGKWIEKASAYQSLMLCPARCETSTFHSFVWPKARVLMISKRLQYLETVTGAIERIDRLSIAAAKRLEKKIEKAVDDGCPLIEGDSCPHPSVIVDWTWRDDVYDAFAELGAWVGKVDR